MIGQHINRSNVKAAARFHMAAAENRGDGSKPLSGDSAEFCNVHIDQCERIDEVLANYADWRIKFGFTGSKSGSVIAVVGTALDINGSDD